MTERRIASVRRRFLTAMVVGSLLALVPSAAAEADTHSITVSPTTDLVTGQVVTVDGTGWQPEADVFVGMCPLSATSTEPCDARFFTLVRTELDGSFSTTLAVSRILIGALTGIQTDCVVEQCAVSAAPLLISTPIHVAVSFRDVIVPPAEPAVTVTPSTGLRGGDFVTVDGTGYVPGVPVYVLMCSTSALSISTCDIDPFPPEVTPDVNGAFTQQIQVSRVINVGFGSTESFDCLVHECVVGAADFNLVSTASMPVTFVAGGQPLGVNPSTDLLDLDVVQVSGSGFLPSFDVTIEQCGPEAPGISAIHCDTARAQFVRPDSAGSIAVEFTVVREIPTEVNGEYVMYDCALGGCSLQAGGFNQPVEASGAISFLDVPLTEQVLTVSPVDGPVSDAQVTGTGFTPGVSHQLQFCGPGDGPGPGALECFGFAPVDVVPDANGAFTTTIGVSRFEAPVLSSVFGFDCLLDAGCAVSIRRSVVIGSTPVVFATPQLGITINSDAALTPGTNDAVAGGSVTCDVATPVSFQGVISQPAGAVSPGVAGGITVDNQWCEPGDPLTMFIPTNDLSVNDVDFDFGPATVDVLATPHRSHLDGTATTASADVQLLDMTALVTLIVEMLQDPANVELRAAISRAIRIRLAQDPVFRAAFVAALKGS